MQDADNNTTPKDSILGYLDNLEMTMTMRQRDYPSYYRRIVSGVLIPSRAALDLLFVLLGLFTFNLLPAFSRFFLYESSRLSDQTHLSNEASSLELLIAPRFIQYLLAMSMMSLRSIVIFVTSWIAEPLLLIEALLSKALIVSVAVLLDVPMSARTETTTDDEVFNVPLDNIYSVLEPQPQDQSKKPSETHEYAPAVLMVPVTTPVSHDSPGVNKLAS
ncbi:MAG: hypothetical protein NTW08_06215 [Gammaproteobacteria bacterium]|nr:hypothetical protein [Gammaproteobacteria bacterium]